MEAETRRTYDRRGRCRRISQMPWRDRIL